MLCSAGERISTRSNLYQELSFWVVGDYPVRSFHTWHVRVPRGASMTSRGGEEAIVIAFRTVLIFISERYEAALCWSQSCLFVLQREIITRPKFSMSDHPSFENVCGST